MNLKKARIKRIKIKGKEIANIDHDHTHKTEGITLIFLDVNDPQSINTTRYVPLYAMNPPLSAIFDRGGDISWFQYELRDTTEKILEDAEELNSWKLWICRNPISSNGIIEYWKKNEKGKWIREW